MARNLDTLGLEGAILVHDYLLALPGKMEEVDALAFSAFVGLASHVGIAVFAGPRN
jgi:hypothetical protein